MEEHPFHPLANRYRLLEGADLEELAESIEARGQLYPVTLWHGQVIDGRNRQRACNLRGIECRYEDRSDILEEDLPEFIADLNERRRHLGLLEQKQLRAERVQRVAQARNKERKSLRTIAEEEGVSEKQVREDLKKSGADPSAPEPEKVKGKDNKEYSARKAKAETNGHAPPPAGPPEEPPPSADKDALGLPVPEKLRPTFDAREKYREARSLLRRLEALVDAIAREPGGEHLRLDLSRQGPSEDKVKYRSNSLRDFKYTLKSTEPHSSVCPWCHRDHPGKVRTDCSACYGLGWVPLRGWKQAPPEDREDVQALAPKEESPE